MSDLNVITLTEILSLLAHDQDDQTMQKVYDNLALLTPANIQHVLETLLDPIAFPELHAFAQGLKKAYHYVDKERVTRNLGKLLGTIGLVCFTLELLNIAEQQGKTSSPPDLHWPQMLLKEPAVQYWFKQVYAPPSSLSNLQKSSTKKQEEANLKLARDHWQSLNLDSLELYRVGTTSFIVRCQLQMLAGEPLVLKCLLFPYTRIPAIADATRNYALHYQTNKIPVATRILSSTDKWILMDFVEGSTLRELVQMRKNAEGQEPPFLRIDLLTSIGKPLLAALNDLSHIGLRHEDLTPSNIMVVQKPDGSVDKIVLIDLGRNYLYTRHVGLEAKQEALFVAPEVKSGLNSEETSDQYSFGMILIELADPVGVQGGTIPDSLYQYAPQLARFIEDLIDKKPENRRQLFPLRDRTDPYAHLCLTFEDLLQVLPSQREMKLEKFFWVQQLKMLLYPAHQLKHAWQLWRRTRSSSTYTGIARHTGRLFGWLVASMVNCWLVFTVTFLWGARDFGIGFFPNTITLVQVLLPHCGGTCVPLLDNLRASDYAFGIANMPARLVGFTIGLVQSTYYANILAGLTARPISGKLAYVTEVFLRLQAVVALPLVLIGNLYEPRWWLILLIVGYPIPALTNILCYLLATRTLKKARSVFSTVPLLAHELRNEVVAELILSR